MIRKALYRTLRTGAALALSAVSLTSLHAQIAPAARRITTAVNNSDRVALSGNIRKDLSIAKDLGAANTATPARHVMLVLQRSDARQAALDQYLSDVQNSSSAEFHHWLTPAEYGTRFGASADDVAAVSAWLQSQGLTIERASTAANVISLSGTVGQLQNAFATSIHNVQINGETHLANTTEPQLPRALAPAVKGLLGLDNFHPRPNITKAPTATLNPTTHRIEPDFTLFSGSTPYLYLDPSDAATVYNTPNSTMNPNYSGTSYDGTGVTVGVVGDSNVDMVPVTNYRLAFLGETSANVNLPKVIIDGVDPGINGDEVETFLDLEVLGGIAPKATINYYASADSDLSAGLFNAIERAVNDNAVSILSISFGACEANLGTGTDSFIAEIYQQAAAQGISVLVSSGDSGAAGCDSSGATTATHGLGVNGLSSTPYNTSVGGTDFYGLLSGFSGYVNTSISGNPPYYRTALKYIPERPWNDSTSVNGALANNKPYSSANIIGGGGGKSSVYTKPAFQSSLTPADGARDIPDVAFLAGNGLDGAVWVICESNSIYGPNCATSNGALTADARFSGAGGTSAATPAFAGMLALVVQSTGHRLGNANNVLYKLAASKYSTVFHDVTAGNISVVCTAGSTNCGSNGFTTGYDATTGYDLASGLGSVDAAAMTTNWNTATGSSSTTALTINGSTSAVTVPHGTSLTFGVTVAPGTATGDVALVNTATAASSSVSTLNGQPSFTIPVKNGTGSASYNGLPGGQYTVYANYGGDTSTASSQSSPISVNIAAEPGSTLLWINPYTPLQAPITNTGAIPYGSYIFAESSVYGTAEGYAGSLGYATGTMTYFDNGSSIGTAPITSGNFASFPGTTTKAYSFAPGLHKLTATFPGDASYKANTSNEVDFTIVKGNTTLVFYPTSATVTSTTTDNVEVDITTSSLANAPTGTLTLTANGKTLTTITSLSAANLRSDGTAVAYAVIPVQGSLLVNGSNTITATYSGDTNYNGSTGTTTLTNSLASFALKATAVNIASGATTGNTSTLTVTPSGNFAGLVNLTCAVTTAPANAISPVTCSVPASINVTGTGSVTGTVTIGSTATTSGGAYVVTITGTDAATGKISNSTTAAITVTATPGITLTNSAAITMGAGATSGNTSTLTVTPTNGYTGAVSLSCAVTSTPTGANSAYPVTCGLAPSSVTLTTSAAATSVLTVNSTARKTASLAAPHGILRGVGGTVLAFGLFLLVPSRRRRQLRAFAALLAIVSLGSLAGCGGGSNSGSGTGTGTTTTTGTVAGTYVVTVTANPAAGTAQTTTVNVTVN